MLWTQQTGWPALLDAARLVDRLGYDTLFADDHLYADAGDPYQPKLEAWTTLTAWAMATERVRLGHWVVANTFRNPGLLAKMATTVDHISGGRVILGIGAAWFELEHRAFGIDFGSSAGERLDWLDESAGMLRALFDGETVTRDGPHYRTQALRISPLPLQPRLPIMIGGGGERKTLRTVARYADIWHYFARPLDDLRRRIAALESHCADVGRDPATIERALTQRRLAIRDDPAAARRAFDAALTHNRTDPATFSPDGAWFGPPELIAEQMLPYLELGFRHLIVELPAPFDQETIERLIGEVKPLLDQAAPAA
jgi:F420-dependent oxidoreductase-like protein